MTKLSLFQAQTIFAKSIIVLGAILVEPAATVQLWDDMDNLPLLDSELEPRLGCINDDPEWTDAYGDGCDWYEDNDEPGCPIHGSDGVGLRDDLGVAKDNCCHCANTSNEVDRTVSTLAPTVSVAPTASAAPVSTLAPTVSIAPTASAAPSPSDSGSLEGDMMQMISSPCTDNWEWLDGFGEGCWWYEANDLPGCPEFGDMHVDEAMGTGIGVANDNCCYCAMELV